MEQIFDLQNPNSHIWLVIGIIFILIEISAIPGIGFLFAGLGAMTLGGLLTFQMVELSGSWSEHIAYFFFFTTVWAVILWKPLQRSINSRKGSYQNIIGTTATVSEELVSGKIGKVRWSGTTMRARISVDSSLQKIPVGENVWVHKNDKGVLSVDVVEPEDEE